MKDLKMREILEMGMENMEDDEPNLDSGDNTIEDIVRQIGFTDKDIISPVHITTINSDAIYQNHLKGYNQGMIPREKDIVFYCNKEHDFFRKQGLLNTDGDQFSLKEEVRAPIINKIVSLKKMDGTPAFPYAFNALINPDPKGDGPRVFILHSGYKDKLVNRTSKI